MFLHKRNHLRSGVRNAGDLGFFWFRLLSLFDDENIAWLGQSNLPEFDQFCAWKEFFYRSRDLFLEGQHDGRIASRIRDVAGRLPLERLAHINIGAGRR